MNEQSRHDHHEAITETQSLSLTRSFIGSLLSLACSVPSAITPRKIFDSFEKPKLRFTSALFIEDCFYLFAW